MAHRSRRATGDVFVGLVPEADLDRLALDNVEQSILPMDAFAHVIVREQDVSRDVGDSPPRRLGPVPSSAWATIAGRG